MPASYPNSAKSFTTKNNGQTIDASHVVDLQLEVTAIETDLTAGLPVARGGTGLTAVGLEGQAALVSGSGLAFGVQASPADGRLTLTSGTPVTTSDVTAATTLYYALYHGNRVALYDGSTGWAVLTFTELSIAVPATTNQMYDVFAYNNSGTAALELLAWTNDTTRATALTTQDGVLVKTGALTRRYLGSFRTTAVSGQTEDSATKRYVWNAYNRVRRPMQVTEATATWTYTSTTVRQTNASAANQLEVVVGVAEVAININVATSASNSTAGRGIWTGIGYDSTTAYTRGVLGQISFPVANYYVMITGNLVHMPAAGYHFYSWNESNDAVGAVTYQGSASSAGDHRSVGLSGYWES